MIVVPALLAAALATGPGACEITDGTLEWGFKESFRAYIDGSIANGEWTTGPGVGYDTPSFTWSDGFGRYDPATGEGFVRFAGSVRFTGHDGLLDTTIGYPQIVFDGDSAVLLLDVAGATMDGEQVEVAEAEFVELTGLETGGEDAVVTVDAETVLTEAGSVAFPNYPAGEAFDPVAVELTLGEGCITYGGTYEPVDPPAAGPQWPWLIGGIAILALPVLAIAGVVVAVVLARRRRRA